MAKVSPVKTLTLRENDGEEYLLISYKEGTVKGHFFHARRDDPG